MDLSGAASLFYVTTQTTKKRGKELFIESQLCARHYFTSLHVISLVFRTIFWFKVFCYTHRERNLRHRNLRHREHELFYPGHSFIKKSRDRDVNLNSSDPKTGVLTTSPWPMVVSCTCSSVLRKHIPKPSIFFLEFLTHVAYKGTHIY